MGTSGTESCHRLNSSNYLHNWRSNRVWSDYQELDNSLACLKPTLIIMYLSINFNQESLPGERASSLDFKDATTARFGHSRIVFCLFLVTNIKGTIRQSSTEKLNRSNLWHKVKSIWFSDT